MPAAPTPQEALRRRLKAARALAGLTVVQLAERIEQPGYGDKTLYAMEADTGRKILPKDFGVLATGCDLPREWFTADLAAAVTSSGASGELDDLRSEVAEIRQEQAALRNLKVAVAELAANSLRHTQELAKLRGTGRRTGQQGEAQ